MIKIIWITYIIHKIKKLKIEKVIMFMVKGKNNILSKSIN